MIIEYTCRAQAKGAMKNPPYNLNPFLTLNTTGALFHAEAFKFPLILYRRDGIPL